MPGKVLPGPPWPAHSSYCTPLPPISVLLKCLAQGGIYFLATRLVIKSQFRHKQKLFCYAGKPPSRCPMAFALTLLHSPTPNYWCIEIPSLKGYVYLATILVTKSNFRQKGSVHGLLDSIRRYTVYSPCRPRFHYLIQVRFHIRQT